MRPWIRLLKDLKNNVPVRVYYPKRAGVSITRNQAYVAKRKLRLHAKGAVKLYTGGAPLMSENKMAEKLFMDQKEAMKSKNRFYLSVIRMLRAELQNAEIAKNAPLNDQEELAILTREVKRRKEALGDYVRSGRQDLITDLKREIEILSKYLPEQLSEDMLVRIVKEAIIESGAKSKQEMGKVMSLLMPRVKGKADGSLVRELVDKNLQ